MALPPPRISIATCSGVLLASWDPDKDGVDVTLRKRALMVDIQLKCTRQPRTTSTGYSFDLDVATYDKLRDPERSASAFLVLVVVPPDVEDWLSYEPERLILACHAYWANVTFDMRPTDRKQIAVPLPRENVLNENALNQMFTASRALVLSQ